MRVSVLVLVALTLSLSGLTFHTRWVKPSKRMLELLWGGVGVSGLLAVCTNTALVPVSLSEACTMTV